MKHIKWAEIPPEQVNESFVRRLAWDGKIMVGQTLVKKGYQVPTHAHENEQITWVMSGAWRFELEGKTVIVGANEMITIPANEPHSAFAVEDLVAYDIFTPPREDWLTGTDSYLRSGG